MGENKVNSIKRRLLSLCLALSMALTLTSPVTMLTASADVVAGLTEIPNFKEGWSWVIGTKANTIGELPTADAIAKSSDPAVLPVGNGSGSYADCRDYVAKNGTTVGTPGSTPSLVLQKSFELKKLDDFSGFMLDAIIDEGAVVFVNGKTALELNVKAVDADTPTSQSKGTRTFGYDQRYAIGDPILQPNKSTFEKLFISKQLFKEGENVITVAVLQDGKASSDILFDAMLYSVDEGLDDITPSGSAAFSGGEWLWTVNNPGGSGWNDGDFIAAGVKNSAAYESDSWRASDAPIGYSSNGQLFTDNDGLDAFKTTTPYSTSTDYKNKTDYPVENLYLRRILELEKTDDILVTMKITFVRNIGVYLNGKKIYEKTDASNQNKTEVELPVRPEDLRAGRNVIGVDLHNTSAVSSSMYFDMELTIEEGAPTNPDDRTKLMKIENSKAGWAYAANVTDSSIAELDVSDWKTAVLPAGNADENSPKCRGYISENGTEAGVCGDTRNLVLQKTVNIADTASIAGLAIDAAVDDAAVIFVNGVPALRLNAKLSSAGTSGIRAFGYERKYPVGDPVEQVNKSNYEKLFLDKSLFKNGDNVITAAVLQDAENSGDILFDAVLYTVPAGFSDTVTPSGADIQRSDEWLWIKNDCENSWLTDGFIPIGAQGAIYNSNAWRSGSAPFGYNTTDNSQMVNPATAIPHPPKRPPTVADPNFQTNDVYLRRIVEVEDIDALARQFDAATMSISRVRNVTVYLNGENVFATTDGTNNDMRSDIVQIPIEKFKTGENVVSVDLQNSAAESSCIYFDMKLIFGKELITKGFVMTPGKNESELGFLWDTPKGAAESEPALQIAKSADYKSAGFKFAESDVLKGGSSPVDSGWQANKVTVTGLESKTEYSYRYGDSKDDLWSEVSTFTTGNAKNSKDSENKVIVFGDPTIGGESGLAATRKAWDKNVNAAMKKIPDASFMLAVGDNANDQNVHYDYLKEPQPFKNLPFASTVGNHETSAFKTSFNFPNWTLLGNTEKGCDYYFSYGNTLYIMLNAFSQNVPEHKKAMQKAIESFPDAKWRVVVTHFDVYGAGPHASGRFNYYRDEIIYLRKNLTPVYDELGIDVVINGHDHSYCRSHFMKDHQPQLNQVYDDDGAVVNPSGTLYITASCGSDGRFYSPEVDEKMNWVDTTGDYKEPQFTGLNITDDSFTISTYLASDTDKVVDAVTIRKKESSDARFELRDEISNANEALGLVSAGTQPGRYPQSAIDDLNSAIKSAQAVFDDANAAQDKLKSAVSALKRAVDELHKNIIPFAVFYNANGGSGTAPADPGRREGEMFKAAANTFTAPVGMAFDRWNTAPDGSGKSYVPGVGIKMPASNLVLYACWKSAPKPPAAVYTVTFRDGNSGRVMKRPARVTLSAGRRATRPQAPVKSGYKFVGWYTSRAFKTKFSFSKAVFANTNVYACFEKVYIPKRPSTAGKKAVKKRQIALKWAKAKTVVSAGRVTYTLEYSTNRKKWKRAYSGAKTKAVVKKLSRNKAYYFRLTAVKNIGGVKVKSKRSKLLKIKTAKK